MHLSNLFAQECGLTLLAVRVGVRVCVCVCACVCVCVCVCACVCACVCVCVCTCACVSALCVLCVYFVWWLRCEKVLHICIGAGGTSYTVSMCEVYSMPE